MTSFKWLFLFTAILCFASACFSGPVVVPENATTAEITQMGQIAMDKDRDNQAIQYFEVIRERFPENQEAVCGADYQIAFIHYKQKKYSIAKEEFNALLAQYNKPEGRALPQKYRILSTIVLKKIAEKQKILAEE
ncbi:MAG: hypothetical protein LBV68_04290 [Spirochaetaceae bacterium]|nr:hypothetical protein [Spirochaetaceae bacterium]